MLRKTLLSLSASAMLGTVVIASNAALALPFGPPGPPPGGPALGGPPPGFGGALPHLGGPPPGLHGAPPHPGPAGPPGFHGGGRGFQGNLQVLRGHSAAPSSGHSGSYSSSNSGSSGYGHSGNYGYGHHHWGRYGAYAYGSDGSGYGDNGCYYTQKYSYTRDAYRRVLVCSGSE